MRPALRPPVVRSREVFVPLAMGLSSLAVAGCGGDIPEPASAVAPARPLRVATGTEADPAAGGRTVVVSATEARTHVGHFRAGQRVQIAVLDAQWNDAPGPDLYDARGALRKRCLSDTHSACVGHGAPLMGLVLITVPDAAAGAMIEAEKCDIQRRLYIPNGAEFEVPFDVELDLGPNDWEDGLYNNAGAIDVEVSRAHSKAASPTERKNLQVSALAPRTFAGRFARGEYVRITVKSGTWNHDPSAALVGSEGFSSATCGAPGHQCVGGDGVPLMGLVLLMSLCDGAAVAMRSSHVERAYIPDGAEVLLASDANLYLAPNDREDDLANNSGSARVRVRAFDR